VVRAAEDSPQLEDVELSFFVRRMSRLTGWDLSSYKREQMRRRLGAVMARTGARNLIDLANMLERDPSRVDEIRDQLTINVSEFFRDPERWQYLEERILPAILRENRRPAIWRAGCSNGAEPYSLAMAMTDLAPHGNCRILATDIDRGILERARAGSGYTSSDVRNVSRTRLAKYFRQERDRYAVVDSIRHAVEFRRQNLLADPFEGGFDLIVCRNVVIYFTEEAKNALFDRLSLSLREGGILFVGGTEMLPRGSAERLTSIALGFYRRVGTR
jgi:chemotaxis protein methyltransferase CheR